MFLPALRCSQKPNGLICCYHMAAHILSTASSMSPKSSQGGFPWWKRVEAMTWHTTSATPAGAPSCLSRPSLYDVYPCKCVSLKKMSVCASLCLKLSGIQLALAVNGGESQTLVLELAKINQLSSEMVRIGGSPTCFCISFFPFYHLSDMDHLGFKGEAQWDSKRRIFKF